MVQITTRGRHPAVPRSKLFALRVALLAGSLLCCGVLFAAAEFAVGRLTNVQLLGIDATLVTPNRFGDSFGNTPGATAIAFGERVEIDSDGFRIDSSQPDAEDAPAILVLGDSVVFGPGVLERLTAVGSLRRMHPDIRFINTSCIGYAPNDYLNVAERLIPTTRRLRAVLLFLCLNDITPTSAIDINTRLQNTKNPGTHSPSRPQRNFLHEWLRCRSRLYVLLKSSVYDSQMAYFQSDLQAYRPGLPAVAAALEPLLAIRDLAAEQAVPFTVFIMPHKAQLRPSATHADEMPQRLIGEFLTDAGIDYVDTLPLLRASEKPSGSLFLRGDPVHLNTAGHALLATIVDRHVLLSGKRSP